MNKELILVVFAICCVFQTASAKTRFKNEQYQSRYCRNYPTNDGPPYRYHRETGRCYVVGEKGPCGELMLFTMENTDFGVCDCDIKQRCGRPLIYWAPKERCYYTNDQGPCRNGKVLVFGFDLKPVCKRNICADEENRRPSYGGKFWFSYKGKCYRTYTQGFCPNKDDILFNKMMHYRPICTKTMDCGESMAFQWLKCLPGQRLDIMGKCRRALEPLNGFNDNVTQPLEVTPKPDNIHCLYCHRGGIAKRHRETLH